MSLLYKRKVRVLISRDGTNCLDVSKLDVVFNITKSMGDNGNSADITIYNLSPQSIKKEITKGSRIIIEAGYQAIQYGMIFDGDIIDFRIYKEDGVTRVLDIKAKDGDIFLNGTFLSQSYAAGMTTKNILDEFVGKGDPNITLGDITTSLLNKLLPRGKVIHGQPDTILRNLAKTEGGRFYVSDRKINLVKADDPPKGQIVSITKTSGLIGSAKQTDDGIEATCLLNPILNLNKFVHIKSDYIERSLMDVGAKKATADLPGEGIYKILKLEHTGGLNENDYYTNIIGVPQPGLSPVKLKNLIK